MKIRIQSETYEYDESRMNVAEARLIKKNAAMGVTEWAQGLKNGDPDALVALVYIAKKRAGEAPKWSDFDNLDLVTDVEVITEDDDTDEGETPADEAPSGKPAKTSGKTRKAAS